MMFPPKDFVTLFTLQIVIFRTPFNIKNHEKETFPMVFRHRKRKPNSSLFTRLLKMGEEISIVQ
ncbi:hypothetical protein CN304_13940 [Bacillus thuringiensis]|uniref:Uncharacterized protein n=2 Tax=Bacillus thuringiensis TaxID=1428 RepID=A0AB36V690_BACTU|nr:hypothetical protein BK771_24890 [Bacillus thuringiensis serovar ostriniae]PEF09711.1 hypothetical protein CON23_25495 [Bacillus thuringiensis]TXR71541.1 hypothetical protein DN400_21540 [Bacillus sp. AR8-1]PES43260.1 hypothetical protein CN499_27660 [Bacillus thuringiensis]PES47912.1 hypothetical protein CN506_28775 [Bacillus thuringiensis]